MRKKIIKLGIWLVLIPAVIVTGATLFQDKQYAWISLCVTVLGCIPFFVSFEKGGANAGKMVIIAALIALSVIGRILFTPLPGFKPVTAMVVITAMYLGSEAGFMTGALSAVLSNFYFGQGPWTPFQMFVWGLIGLCAGAAAKTLKKSRLMLCLCGVLAGIVFSALMDVWTVLWWDGHFNWTRYAAAIISALPFTAVYAVSNVVFLLLLERPIGGKLERIKLKYGI